MSWQLLLAALGLMAVFEGLVFALAPLRFEDMLEALRDIPVGTRRMIGLAIIGLGVILIMIASGMCARMNTTHRSLICTPSMTAATRE